METANTPVVCVRVLFEFRDYQGSVRVRVPVKFVKKVPVLSVRIL